MAIEFSLREVSNSHNVISLGHAITRGRLDLFHYLFCCVLLLSAEDSFERKNTYN